MNDEAEPEGQVSVQEALRIAMSLHRGNRPEDAEALYRKILAAEPANADALHFLALLMRQHGECAEALALMRRAVAAAPGYASAHNNLGNLLYEEGDLEGATMHLARALELEPNDPRALNNMGNVAGARREPAAAIGYFERAIAVAPQFGVAYENLGRAHMRCGDVARAYPCFCKAVMCDPSLTHSKQFIGMALCELGRIDEARAHYRSWLEAEPDDPRPRHLLGSVCAEAAPRRATDEYVRRVFDSFAETFDVQLRRLEYRAPQLVVEALQESSGAHAGSALEVLDAGCGTGLCGALLRPLARTLHGVDLSAQMLQRARAAGHYDELIEAELAAFMRSRPERYQAITCADTLCYFGALEEVAAAAHSALGAHGHFVFTLEEIEQPAAVQRWRLTSSGRYVHGEGYVREVLQAAGLAVVKVIRAWLRTEAGKPVAGLVVVAQRTGR